MRQLPTIDRLPVGQAIPAGDPLSRRDFLSTTACAVLAAALAAACGESSPTGLRGGGSPAPDGVTLAGNVLTVPLSSVPELGTPGGYRIITFVGSAQANVIVLNVAGSYRAFTAVCTHQNCIVSSFNGSRIHCDCHGSEFDATGRNVAGPAPRPLTEFSTTFDPASRVITVVKG